MNESLFILHVILVMAFGFGALRMGKAALTAWIALQAVLANLFVIKQIEFFRFSCDMQRCFCDRQYLRAKSCCANILEKRPPKKRFGPVFSL